MPRFNNQNRRQSTPDNVIRGRSICRILGSRHHPAHHELLQIALQPSANVLRSATDTADAFEHYTATLRPIERTIRRAAAAIARLRERTKADQRTFDQIIGDTEQARQFLATHPWLVRYQRQPDNRHQPRNQSHQLPAEAIQYADDIVAALAHHIPSGPAPPYRQEGNTPNDPIDVDAQDIAPPTNRAQVHLCMICGDYPPAHTIMDCPRFLLEGSDDHAGIPDLMSVPESDSE